MRCVKPFTKFVVGNECFFPCCPSWMEKEGWAVGSYLELEPWDAWNHPKYQQMRQDVLDGESSHCKPVCPVRGQFRRREWHKVVMDRSPYELVFATDPMPSEVTVKQERVWKYIRAFQAQVGRMVFITHGEPFTSPVYLPILQELDSKDFPHAKITLFTNGLLLPKYWDSLHKISCIIDSVAVSIDAATKETYEKMRLADWEDLQKSLAFIQGLGLTVWFDFTVCHTNFREIPTFAAMAEEYGARARFASLATGEDIDTEKFLRENVSRKNHPQHQEFRQLLSSLQFDQSRTMMVRDENHIGIS